MFLAISAAGRPAQARRSVSLMRRRAASLAAAFVTFIAAPVLARSPPTWAAQVTQWGVQEITLTSQRSYANPFAQVKLQVAFRCGADTTTIAGFYDGDSTWRARFMPDRTGTCTFKSK